MVLFVDDEVFFSNKSLGDSIRLGVFGQVSHRRARNDQRSTSFVDQDIVDLVDDRIMQRALDLLHVTREAIVPSGCHTHVVTQVIETQFVVRRVSDIRGVSLLTLIIIHPALDVPYGQS